MEQRPHSSRRNSITSFNSTTSSVISTATTSPRDLSTDSMYDLHEKFQRKSRLKTSKLQQPMMMRSNSYSTHPHHRYTPHHSSSYQHQRYRSFQQQQHPQPSQPSQPPLHQQQQQQKGSFYFPNGEIFTPRQTPKSRNRPSKIHHTQYQPPQPQQRRYPVPQSPSMPNLVVVPTQNGIPPRRNPGLMKNSISFQNPIILQEQVHLQQPCIEPLNNKSLVSSSGSSPNNLQQTSSTSSSTISLNQLNSSSSPTPSNTDDTPASSISCDEKLTNLSSEKLNHVEEQVDVISAIELKKEEEIEAPVTKPKPVEKRKIEPLTIKPVVSQKRSSQSQTPIEKKSFIGKVFKKLFGSSKKPKIDKPKNLMPAPTLKDSKLNTTQIVDKKIKEILPDIDETDTVFSINFDEELKDNESVLSFTKNDEIDVNISNTIPINQDTTTTNDDNNDNTNNNNDTNNYMDFADEDEDFLLKLIEVGETTFPDLDKPGLGTTRRKSLKMQKNLSRNSTISSQNSNNSIKTFKTSSSYLEELDRMISNFENSNSNDDRIENLQIIRNNTLKTPSSIALANSIKSSLKSQTKDKSLHKKSHVVFANTIYINDTHSSLDYDRFNIDLKKNYQMLSTNPQLVKEIRFELNSFKEAMEIHELSRQNTHLFGA